MTAPDPDEQMRKIALGFLIVLAFAVAYRVNQQLPCPRPPTGNAWSTYGHPGFTGPTEGVRLTQELRRCRQ